MSIPNLIISGFKELHSDFCRSARFFKKDAAGRDIWYPNGLSFQGYIVPDIEKYWKLEIWSNYLYMAAFFILIPLMIFNFTLGSAFLIFCIIWYILVRRDYKKRLKKYDGRIGVLKGARKTAADCSYTFLFFALIVSFVEYISSLSRSSDTAFLFLLLFFVAGGTILLKMRELKPARGKYTFQTIDKHFALGALKGIIYTALFFGVSVVYGLLVVTFANL